MTHDSRSQYSALLSASSKLLESAEWPVRLGAATGLACMAPSPGLCDRVAAMLGPHFSDWAASVRRVAVFGAAVGTACSRGVNEAVALMGRLLPGDAYTRIGVALALGVVGITADAVNRTLDILMMFQQDQSPGVRTAAALSAGMLMGIHRPAGVPDIVSTEDMFGGPRERQAVVLGTALVGATTGRPESVEAVIGLLDNPMDGPTPATLLARALAALCRGSLSEDADALREYLGSGEWAARLGAVLGLSLMCAESHRPLITPDDLRPLLSDPNWQVCRTAAFSMGAVLAAQDDGPLKPLASAVKDGSNTVRAAAGWALVHLVAGGRGDIAAPLLERLLSDDFGPARRAAAVGIGVLEGRVGHAAEDWTPPRVVVHDDIYVRQGGGTALGLSVALDHAPLAVARGVALHYADVLPVETALPLASALDQQRVSGQ